MPRQPGLTVRPATPDDAESISDIQVRCWQWAYDGLMPADYLAGLDANRDERTQRWREGIVAEGRGAFVALDAGDRIIGFVMSGVYRDQADRQPVDGVGEINAIYADPAEVGTGAGRALMDAAVDWLSGRGLRPIRLWVLEGNARARRFYERYGFVADGATSTYTAGSVEVAEVRYTLEPPHR
jgi:GNAT superfamily N-acetyltransferase